ncbi:MAG: penicillin-binding protein 1C [Synergistaceae bacterium]|nr:penicillin-binding protein 1C [Synergistaceae bacterium]
MRLKRILLYLTVVALVTPSAFFALSYALTPPLSAVLSAVRTQHVSPALYDAKGRLFYVRLSEDSEWSLPVSLSEMGRWLPVVAVGVEDRRFPTHRGVDFLAVARAAWQNAVSRRVMSGASTITSQVIRLSISNPEHRRRDLLTKAVEFALAVKLERGMIKDEILETYLNRAPFGGNIRGVQAAAMIYFGKPAAKLSPGEACLLIGMLKSPSHYRPDRRPEAARRRRDFIIRLLEKRSVFTSEEAEGALLEDLPSRWLSPPMRAFHFAEAVFNGETASFGGRFSDDFSSRSGRIDTTLDLEIQTKLEAIMRGAVAPLPDSVTAAAGVVDNKSGALVAWVGNARFSGTPGSPLPAKEYRAAWVDCGRALRSPGSALKPFAYLAAFDKGILTPGSLLADTPLSFSGRAPRNFDLTYRGAVSARVALSDSLNAPAVRVLRMTDPESVLDVLRAFGFESLNERASHYGDSLILGGCEVSVMQMLTAYSALANRGVYRRVALLKKDVRRDEETRLVSAAAAWMVSDILDNRSRLSAFARETLGSRTPGGHAPGNAWRVALKTGTSYGLRDAWTAAWTPDFTVAVWVGDPGGTSWPGLVGAQVAAPVALSALRVLSPNSRWYAPPEGAALREVCSLSGHPPSAACLSTRRDWYVEGVSRSVPCDLHVVRGGKSTLLWPVEFARRNIPPSDMQKRPYVSISSPIAGATYYLAPLAREQKIPLRAEGAVGRVWWYMDAEYIGTAAPGETFFYAFPYVDGQRSVSVVDEEGRAAAAHFTVAFPGKSASENHGPLKLE